MNCVRLRLAWNSSRTDKSTCKLSNLIAEEEYGGFGEKLQPTRRRLTIAASALAFNGWGNYQFVGLAAMLPPIDCKVLASLCDGIPAGPGGEVAEDRGFDVDARLVHGCWGATYPA